MFMTNLAHGFNQVLLMKVFVCQTGNGHVASLWQFECSCIGCTVSCIDGMKAAIQVVYQQDQSIHYYHVTLHFDTLFYPEFDSQNALSSKSPGTFAGIIHV